MKEDFLKWADNLANEGTHGANAGVPSNPIDNNVTLSGLDKLILKSSPLENTSDYSYNTADISNRFPRNFKEIDNEELYAQNQGGWEKAYNGVAKMVGTAGTTFINGTAGLVYGIAKWNETGKLASFWDNPLTNSLNEFNAKWEDKYAHYKTLRERNGSWWEPENLFTGNFLWDGVVKNLGFSLGAMAGGFAWGGLFKAIGLTGKLMSTGVEMAAKTDAAISESLLLPQASRLGSINTKLQGLWNGVKPVIGQGLMKTDKVIVATFATAGESGIESLSNAKQFRETMIEDFKTAHGYYPEKEDLDKINKYSENVGNWSLGLNAALLSFTNYVQLSKIWASAFKPEKQVLNNVARQSAKYAETLPEKGLAKLAYKTKNVASLFFNPIEAFEEGGQYAITTGTQNYFGKKYRDHVPSVIDDGLLYGVKQALFTDEGTLNIFLGGFSGALQTSGVFGLNKHGLPTMFQTGLIGKRGFTGYGGEDARFRAASVDAFNKSMIKDKLQNAYLNIKAGEIIQEERQLFINQGDFLESRDLEFDYAHTFIDSRLKYNAKEFITEEINSLKQEAATDEGFSKLQQEEYASPTDTKETFLA
jgi:hypothetical protein